MSELQEFVKKRTANLTGISCRKLYGLDAFYLDNTPFIVISSSDQIVIRIDDFEVKKSVLKIPQVTPWILKEKPMDNWFALPDTFNKKKNKLSPILEMTSKVLLNPRKEKKKRKNKSKKLKPETVRTIEKKPSLLKRLFKF